MRALCAASADQSGSGKAKQFDLKVGGRNPTDKLAWNEIVTTLKDANVTMLSPQEVAFSQEAGAVVVDIRPKGEFTKGFIMGAVSVPLFQLIDGWGPYQVVRRFGFAAFGVSNATEPNPDFLEGMSLYHGLNASGSSTLCS